MSLTPLCELPEDEPIKVEAFLQLTDAVCKEAAANLTKSVWHSVMAGIQSWILVLFISSMAIISKIVILDKKT